MRSIGRTIEMDETIVALSHEEVGALRGLAQQMPSATIDSAQAMKEAFALVESLVTLLKNSGRGSSVGLSVTRTLTIRKVKENDVK